MKEWLGIRMLKATGLALPTLSNEHPQVPSILQVHACVNECLTWLDNCVQGNVGMPVWTQVRRARVRRGEGRKGCGQH